MTSIIVDSPARPGGTWLPSRRQLKRFGLGAGALLFGLAATAYGYDWWRNGRFIETTDDAYVGGEVTAIAPRVAGLIAEVAVSDNQPVHAGDLLVRLDDRDYRASLARAEAALAGAEATLAHLDAERHLQQALVAEARAGIAGAEAETTRARDDESRFRALAATAAASVQTAQRADATYKQALAGGAKARAVLEAALDQIDVIETERLQALAARDVASADRDMARLNLSYTELRAPIDGTVGNRSARVGAFAGVGTQLVSLVPARGLWVDANFKESQLASMRAGERVTIAADVLPGEVFHGHVESLAPATGAEFSVLPAENATGNFTKIVQRVPIRIALDGDASALGRLRPGLSVTAAVDRRGVAGTEP
jgi:membrane fusion protein (multidrug efflux system)